MLRGQAKAMSPSSQTPPYSGGLFSMFHWMSTFSLGEAVINTVAIKTATVHRARALQCAKCLFGGGGLSVASELSNSFSILS